MVIKDKLEWGPFCVMRFYLGIGDPVLCEMAVKKCLDEDELENAEQLDLFE